MKLQLAFLISTALLNLIDGQDNATTLAPLPAPDNATISNAPTTVAPTIVPPTLPPVTLVPACTSSQQCAAGFFCSSSSVTCEALNCTNWLRGTPLGEKAYSEAPCLAGGFQVGTAFCGYDGNCYEYNCQNWYTWGPVEYTGYDPIVPVPLACNDYASGATEYMNSVTFGCRPYQPGNKVPETKSWTHFFNQLCLATPRANDSFKCYQNKFGTDYTGFQGEVSRLSPPTCDPNIYENGQPLYWYILLARQDRKGAVTNYKQGRNDTLNGDSFNANLAEKTFFAVITSSDNAPQQSFPASTAAPAAPEQPPPSGAGMVGVLAALSMMIASLSFRLAG